MKLLNYLWKFDLIETHEFNRINNDNEKYKKKQETCQNTW